MKLKKKSGLMGAVIALSAASLVSVGFASWVISQGDEKNVEGNIIVDTVTTEQHVITWTPTDATSINFTRPASEPNPALAHNWLNESTENYESLSATYQISVSHVNDTLAVATPKFTADLKVGFINAQSKFEEYAADAGFNAAVTAKYIVGLPEAAITNAAVDTSAKTFTATVSFTFVWGQHFGGQNPYLYYNAHLSTDKIGDTDVTYGEDAVESLTALHSLLENAKYQLTLKFAE